MKIKLSNEKLRYIALFEELTGVTPKDFVKSGNKNRFTFVVSEVDMGKAIGENGRNIKKVRQKLSKDVNVVKYSPDPKEFLKNIFSPIEIQKIRIDEEEEKKKAIVNVDMSEKGRVVGRNGWNIERARKLLDRHHGISEIILA